MIIKVELANLSQTNTVVDLLNKVTIVLHKKGINQWKYPWNKDDIKIDIENKNVFVILKDNLIIGTFAIKDTSNINIDLIEAKNKYLYRVAILPEYQGEKIGQSIIEYAVNLSNTLDQSLFLDCWAGNKKLKDFYKKCGFKLIGEIPEDDYFISIFKS